MSAFKALRDVSKEFEDYSRRVSAELFSAKVEEPFEDVVAKKIRHTLLFTSKLRLLQAKSMAESPLVTEKIKTEHSTILEYEETATRKIIEQLVVKALTQSHTVKKLLTTPNQALNPELAERKEKIFEQLTKYGQKETQLRSLQAVLKERELQLLDTQQRWDSAVGRLKDTTHQDMMQDNEECSGPLKKRLQVIQDKTDIIRWLIVKIVTSRYDHDYNWTADPDGRLRALALARRRNDVL